MSIQISSAQVIRAVALIAHFCEEHAVEIDAETIAEMTIALRDQKDFNWSLSDPAFRGVYIRAYHMRFRHPAVVVIMDSNPTNGVNEKLTRLLNADIFPEGRIEWTREVRQ